MAYRSEARILAAVPGQGVRTGSRPKASHAGAGRADPEHRHLQSRHRSSPIRHRSRAWVCREVSAAALPRRGLEPAHAWRRHATDRDCQQPSLAKRPAAARPHSRRSAWRGSARPTWHRLAGSGRQVHPARSRPSSAPAIDRGRSRRSARARRVRRPNCQRWQHVAAILHLGWWSSRLQHAVHPPIAVVAGLGGLSGKSAP